MGMATFASKSACRRRARTEAKTTSMRPDDGDELGWLLAAAGVTGHHTICLSLVVMGVAEPWTSERRRLLSCTCAASACMGSDERARVEMHAVVTLLCLCLVSLF